MGAMNLTLVLLFASVAAATGALVWLLTEPQATRRRLSRVAQGSKGTVGAESVIEDAPSVAVKRARSLIPRSPAAMNRVQAMMTFVGFEGFWPAILFVVVQLTLAASAFVAGLNIFSGPSRMMMAGALAVLGYYAPTFWLGMKVEARKTQIRNGLPDAIDLLIVCIEAGSGVDQALARVGEELKIAYPVLAKEIETIASEMRAGTPRMDAFRHFAERTRVDDVRQLVAMLVQTDRFGTSLGQALRTHADASRTKRRQRAEEKAAKLGVKLLFPLVFCLFPAFYLVVLGPSMLRIFRELVWGSGLGTQ